MPYPWLLAYLTTAVFPSIIPTTSARSKVCRRTLRRGVLCRLSPERARWPGRSALQASWHGHWYGPRPDQIGQYLCLRYWSVWGNVKPVLRSINALWQDYASQPHIQRRTASLREQGEWRVQQKQEEMASHATEKPIHPNYLAAVASRVLRGDDRRVGELPQRRSPPALWL